MKPKLVLFEGDVLRVAPRHWNGKVYLFKFIGLHDRPYGNEEQYQFMYQEGEVDSGFNEYTTTEYPVGNIEKWYADGGITFIKKAVEPVTLPESLFEL